MEKTYYCHFYRKVESNTKWANIPHKSEVLVLKHKLSRGKCYALANGFEIKPKVYQFTKGEYAELKNPEMKLVIIKK